MKGPAIRSETSVYDKLRALPRKEVRLLARAVEKASHQALFYYKRRNVHPMGLAPMAATRDISPALHALTRILYRFQMSAPELHRADYRGFAGVVRLEKGTRAWHDATASLVPKPWPLLMRPDYTLGVRRGATDLTLFELNSLMLGGIHIQSAALRIMHGRVLPMLGTSPRGLGLVPAAPVMDLLKAWLAECRRRRGAGRGCLALLESLPPGGGFSELPRIERDLRADGWLVRHGDPKELVVGRGGAVTLRGAPVAYAFRDFSFEDVARPGSRSTAGFAKLWLDGRVAPGPPADFDQKGILECFTSEDFAPLFTRAQSLLLRRHVPWTRVLFGRRTASPEGRTVDLPSFAVRRRQELVIKPSWSAGGEGILLGPCTAAGAWERAVHRAVREPGAWAVQSYVDNPAVPCVYLRDGRIRAEDCRCTLGAFHDGARFGYHLRVSTRPIVNVAQGGALTPLYFQS